MEGIFRKQSFELSIDCKLDQYKVFIKSILIDFKTFRRAA